MYVLCVSQDTPLLESVIEPLEEECVFPLLIHHLSSLRSLRPSCRTSLSHIVLTTSPPGLLFCHRSSPTLPCVAASAPSDAFVTRLSGNPANPLLRANFSCLVVIVVVSPRRTQDDVEHLIILRMCFITLCLCSTESCWSLPRLSHTP